VGVCASFGRHHSHHYFNQKSGSPRLAPPIALVASDGASERGCRHEKNQCPTKC
jgi:hypothetical protein